MPAVGGGAVDAEELAISAVLYLPLCTKETVPLLAATQLRWCHVGALRLGRPSSRVRQIRSFRKPKVPRRRTLRGFETER